MMTRSVEVALRSSVAAKVKVMVVLETCGAAKVVDIEVALARVMSRVESCVHRYVSGSPSGSVAVPASMTVWPPTTARSGPAPTAGGRLRWCGVMAWSGAAAMPFPDRSATASWSMSSCGVVRLPTAATWEVASVAVRVAP